MKRLTIGLVALMLLSASALATDTRVLTMGDNNMILLDDANIWMFPSRVFEYPNLAIGEFGVGDDFNQFGIHWKFGSDNPIVLGTYFTDLGAAYPSDLAGSVLVPFDNNLDDNRRIDLFYGNGLANFNYGTRFSYFSSGQEADMSLPAVDQSKESFSYYDLDLGLTEKNGKWDVAFNIAIGSWTDEVSTGDKETEADGYMDLALKGRYFIQHGPDYTFIPHVTFLNGKHGIKYYMLDVDTADVDLTEKYTLTGFDLGFGTNYTPTANVLAVCDFGFAYLKWKEELENLDAATSAEQSVTYTVLPYFKIGLDADVFKWMDIRLGATSYWTSEKNNFDNYGGAPGPFTGDMKYGYADNATYLGFGFHWNKLYIDTYTDPELFLQGFDFISGNGDVDMNFRISAVYEM